MPIRLLQSKVVSQIAAGEVVERPASAVKELVENSLDAGATRITVEVEGGGLSLIRVTDNGKGIPVDEVELAFQRHATSKIANLSDLERISSLGFRGEALPSIAAVADLDMVTCTIDERQGTFISLKDGVVMQKSGHGRAQGTTVTVRNLFRRVPARLKFLKSLPTENSHIASVVSRYALAFPEVRFSLSIDRRSALRTSGSGKLSDSIVAVYGADLALQMIEVNGDVPSQPPVSGMVSLPQVGRSGRGSLSFFVNRRWVNSRLLGRAVEDAYQGLLMTGRHPLAIINITLPPQEIDVNVHPTKTEVRFCRENVIFGTVQKAVRMALVGRVPVPDVNIEGRSVLEMERPAPVPNVTGGSPPVQSPLPIPPASPSLPALRVLGQLSACYIIAEGPDGLYLIDQHAAHERILFEQLKLRAKDIEVQGLLEPVVVEFSPEEDEVLKCHAGELSEIGFSIEPFGDRNYMVRAIPSLLSDKDWAAVIREIAGYTGQGSEDWREKAIMTIACHSAVRAGQVLGHEQMRELVGQLEQAGMPHTCPHGRPYIIRLSSGQLRREFGRS